MIVAAVAGTAATTDAAVDAADMVTSTTAWYCC